jgi:hypothetical protein
VKLRAKILLVLGLVVVLGVIFLWPHGGYRRELEAYKKQLIARGEKLTLAELVPPPPPPDVQNGGPALLAVMRDLKKLTNFPVMMPRVAPGLARIASTNLSANEMIGYEQNLSNAAKLRAAIAAPAIYVHATYDPDANLGSPVFVELRDAERLLVTTGAQALFASNFPEVRTDLLAALDLCRSFSSGPDVRPPWLRAETARQAFNATWEALQSDAWSEHQLTELQDRWQGMDFLSYVPAAIAIERAKGIAFFAQLRETAPNGMAVWMNPAFLGPTAASWNNGFINAISQGLAVIRLRQRFRSWKSSWSYQEELYFLQLTEAERESAQAAVDSGAFVPVLVGYKSQAAKTDQYFRDRTNRFLINYATNRPPLMPSFAYLALTETGRRICVTAIALKRYHLQHGVYPATLNDLVPTFLPAVPIDFMDGKPLRYKLRSDGDFLLYSVGLDGVDEGGDPRPDGGFLLYWPWNDWPYSRDIVWPRVATPAALEEYREKYGSATNTP